MLFLIYRNNMREYNVINCRWEAPASTFAIDEPTVHISCFDKIEIIADKMYFTDCSNVDTGCILLDNNDFNRFLYKIPLQS